MSEMAAETAAPEAPAETTEAPAEETWAGPSQEQWQGVEETLGYLAEALQPGDPGYQEQQAEPIVLDPLAENFQQQLDAYLEQKVAERVAPYQDYTTRMLQREGSELEQDILTDLAASGGEFDFKAASALARTYMPEAVAQYGFGPQAAEAALAQAAEDVRAYEARIGEAYHQKKLNELSTLSGAPREPGAAGAPATSTTALPTGGDEFDVLRRYFPTSKPGG